MGKLREEVEKELKLVEKNLVKNKIKELITQERRTKAQIAGLSEKLEQIATNIKRYEDGKYEFDGNTIGGSETAVRCPTCGNTTISRDLLRDTFRCGSCGSWGYSKDLVGEE